MIEQPPSPNQHYLHQQQSNNQLLDQFVAPGLRLWMLIGLVCSVLLVMIVIVCCFVRIRIPRTKRQIELRAAKRRKRRALRESGAGTDAQGDAQEGEQNQYRGGQTIVLNSFNGGGGNGGTRRNGGGGGGRGAMNNTNGGRSAGQRSVPV